jgi:hypothetical protein
MSLETKGTVKYDPDVKAGDAEYLVECKPLGICECGSGVLETDIETLTEKVRAAISDEFHIPPCDVVLARYSMSLTFDVSAPVHKTLDQFDTEAVLKKTADIVNSGTLDGPGYTARIVSHDPPKKKKGKEAAG